MVCKAVKLYRKVAVFSVKRYGWDIFFDRRRVADTCEGNGSSTELLRRN